MLLSELITASNNRTEEALDGCAQLAGQFVTASKPPPAMMKRYVCPCVSAYLSAGWQTSPFACIHLISLWCPTTLLTAGR